MRYIALVLLIMSCSRNTVYDYAVHTDDLQSCDAYPFTLELLVDAKHFDYRNGSCFLRSFFDSEDAAFGHAWMILRGIKEGKAITLEGGHSGELGLSYPRYLDQLIESAKKGERNPARHLFAPRSDGYFEEGSGGHLPTYAIVIPITEAAFDEMYSLIVGHRYPFSRYSIVDGQCTTFVVKLASLAGVVLDHETTLSIPQTIRFDGQTLTLWDDPQYGSITLATPDKLEESMKQAVREKQVLASRTKHKTG